MKTAIERWFSAELRRCAFLESYPLYTYIVGRFRLRDTSDVEVMAVSGEAGQPVLHINRKYFGDKSDYLPGVLLHEIHHVVLGHLSDPRFRRASIPRAMTIATEISANEDICEPLPGEPIRHEQFADLGIGPGQSTWERYELIAASMAKNPAAVRRIPQDALGCADTLSRHSEACGEFGAIDSQVVAELLATTASIRNHDGSPARIAGRTPGQLLEALQEVNTSAGASRDWKALLRQFARSYRGREQSYTRPNRRFPQRIGEVPGNTRRCKASRKKLLAVIDTSSSMTTDVLSEVFTELKRLEKHADVTVVECDAAIQRVYPVGESSGTVQGRGGTDLRPPFEHKFLQKHTPGGIVYFTDGAGPYPEKPPRAATLWFLTDDRPFDCPWGRQVRMRAPGIG